MRAILKSLKEPASRAAGDNRAVTRWDQSGYLSRQAAVTPQSWDETTREISVTWTTGARVRRYDWWEERYYDEELVVDQTACDLSRLLAGAPLLRDHDPTCESTIGVVVSAEISGGVGTARIRLDADDDDGTIRKLIGGIVRGISVGYIVRRWEVVPGGGDGGVDLYRAVDWLPMELSATPVQADIGAHTRSAGGGITMAQDQDTDTAPAVQAEDTRRRDAAISRAAAAAEAKRQGEIREIIRRSGVPEESMLAMLDDPDATVEQARAIAFEVMIQRQAANPTRSAHAVQVGTDETVTARNAMVAVLARKLGGRLTPDEEQLARRHSGDTVRDLARIAMDASGTSTRGMYVSEIMDRTLSRASHSTTDFPSILMDSARKVLRDFGALSPEYTFYTQIASQRNYSDFELRHVVETDSSLGVLPEVMQGETYSQVTYGDRHVSMRAIKHGVDLPLTLEMMLADDLGAFQRQLVQFARSSTMTAANQFARLFLDNQVMADGKALFHVDHANIGSSGGAPTSARIGALDDLLRAQTDPSGAAIGMGGTILLATPARRQAIEQLYSDHYSPTDPANAVTVPLGADARRYPAAFGGWANSPYILCTGDPTAAEYGFLDSDGGPVMTENIKHETDSLIYHCRFAFGCGITDHRAFAINMGA